MSRIGERISHEVIKKVCEELVPFNRFLGVSVRALSPGFAELSIPFRSELVGDVSRPALHGGVLSALLDAAGGAAVFTEMMADDRVSTIDLLIDYLRPAPLTTIVARAQIIRLGSRIASVQLSAFAEGDEQHLIASGRAAYNLQRPRAAQDTLMRRGEGANLP